MLNMNTLKQLTDLQATTLYAAELAHLPKLSRAEELILIDHVRQGDREAREALIVSCLSYALGQAHFFYMERQPKHDDLLDLAQEASLQMIKGLDSALTKSNPASYLRGIARRAISMYCIYHSGLIKKPLYTLEQLRQLDQRPSKVESLDAPIYNEGKHILVEFIEAPATQIEPDEEDEQKRFTDLYNAISRLSKTQREVIVRLYGLSGKPMETASEIDPSSSNLIYAHANAARKRLRVLLQNEEA